MVGTMLSGLVPAVVTPFFFGATLVPKGHVELLLLVFGEEKLRRAPGTLEFAGVWRGPGLSRCGCLKQPRFEGSTVLGLELVIHPQRRHPGTEPSKLPQTTEHAYLGRDPIAFSCWEHVQIVQVSHAHGM